MKTHFIFSIDVETMRQGTPERDILGRIPGRNESFGIEKIMDLLEARQARATFFLNAYEVAKSGADMLARASRLIHARGHDLELHTHPRPMYGCYGMSQAPLAKQTSILEKGITLLESWTGKRVVAHRAGAFSANTDTLHALQATGMQADCSLSPGSRVHVPLVDELGASNAVRYVDGLWEIPVTYYEQLRLGPWHSRRILDIEGSSFAEIRKVTNWAVGQGLPTVCILMHSFSLTRHGKPNHRVMRRLSALVAWLHDHDGIEISTVETLCECLNQDTLPPAPTRAPHTGPWLTWCRAVQCWNDGWKNFLVAAIGLVCLAVLACGGIYSMHLLLASPWGSGGP